MTRRLCSVCGVVASSARCSAHPEKSGAHHVVHVDPRWTRLSKRMIARHVGQHGYVCPGDGTGHAPHATRDLTLDHVLQLQDGGAPFDTTNVRVLCRSWNSTLGARRATEKRAGRAAPRVAPATDERAAIRARFL